MSTKRSRIVKPEDYDKFLEYLSETGCVISSSRISGVSTSTLYRHRSEDPSFSDHWESSISEFSTNLLVRSLGDSEYTNFDELASKSDISYFLPYLGTPSLGDIIPQILKQRFLWAFSDTRMLSRACELTGIPRSTVWRWRREDSEFIQSCNEVYLSINHDLLDALVDRGINGSLRPIVHKGEVVGERRVQSVQYTVYALRCLAELGYSALPKLSVEIKQAEQESKREKFNEMVDIIKRRIETEVRQELAHEDKNKSGNDKNKSGNGKKQSGNDNHNEQNIDCEKRA